MVDRNASYPTGALDWCWAGALTDTSFSVKADVVQGSGPARIVVSVNADYSNPAFVSDYAAPVASTGAVRSYKTLSFDVTGLAPNTTYYYQVQFQGAPNNATVTRSLKTAPAAGVAAAFRTIANSCSHLNVGVAPSQAAYRSIIQQSMALENPLICLHGDDIMYSDVSSTSVNVFRDANARFYNQQPSVQVLMQTVPFAYVPGDHDCGPNDCTLDSANGETIFRNMRTVYRETVPHYPFTQQVLGESNIDHVILTQSFDVAKVRHLLLDATSQSRTGGSALGRGIGSGDYWDQLTWLGTALNQAAIDGIKWVFLCLPRSWNGYNQTCFNDTFTADRTAISDLIEACTVPVVLLVGDAHCCAFDDGTNSAAFCTDGFGSFPHIQASGVFNTGVNDVGVFSWNGANTFVANGVGNPSDAQYVVIDMSADNLSWTAAIKGVPINSGTFAATTLKTVSTTDVTPAVSFVNAAPSVAHGSPLTVNLNRSWFGACSVHWASSDGQSGNVSFLPNKKRASFAITFVSAGSPTITLSSPSGCTISGTNPATVTVS